jgi:hypothetical protein
LEDGATLQLLLFIFSKGQISHQIKKWDQREKKKGIKRINYFIVS